MANQTKARSRKAPARGRAASPTKKLAARRTTTTTRSKSLAGNRTQTKRATGNARSQPIRGLQACMTGFKNLIRNLAPEDQKLACQMVYAGTKDWSFPLRGQASAAGTSRAATGTARSARGAAGGQATK